MKKIISIAAIMLVVCALCVFLAPGATVEAKALTEGYYTYTVSNGKATITDFDTSISGDIIIPSTLGGYPVTTIGDEAFSGCTSIKSVTIPDSVTTIGNGAFSYCSSLTSVTIPNSVTKINNWVFAKCTSLSNVNIPNSVTSIGEYAFPYCTSLKSITIPNSVISIGYEAFFNCHSLINVVGGNNVRSVADEAFDGTPWYNNQPDGLVYIGKSAYMYKGKCNGTVTIKDGTVELMNFAFVLCRSEIQSVIIPTSLTHIRANTFSGCDNLSTVYYTGSQSNWNRINIDEGNEQLKNDTKYYNGYNGNIMSAPEIYLTSATCNGYDVLTSTARLDCSINQNVNISIKAKSTCAITEYTLLQDDKVIAKSSTGEFSINAIKFKAKKQVNVRVKNAYGSSYTYGINISVYYAQSSNIPLINEYSLGKDISIKLDDDIPLVGGLEVKFKKSNLPVYAKVSDDKIQFGINIPTENLGTMTKQKLMTYVSQLGYNNKHTPDVSISCAGYAECAVDEDGNIKTTKGLICVSMSFKNEFDFPFNIGIPIIVEVSVSASGELTLNIIGYDWENSEFIFPDLDWSLKGEITLKAGVGIKGLSAGVYGALKNTWSGSLLPYFEFEKWTIYGDAGLYGKIGIFETKRPIFSTRNLQVYPYKPAVSSAMLSYAALNAEELYSPEEYSLITYAARLSNALETYAIENGWVLDSDAYDYTEPVVVTCGDTKVMAYLDYSDDRSVSNSQVLVYRIYDAETDTWSDAYQLDENCTADAEFKLYSDGTNIYIVYTEANEELADDIDIYSYTEKVEVCVAVFNKELNKFDEPIRLTNNALYETMPEMGYIDGVLTAAWVQNNYNDIFGANTENAIMISQFVDGEWTSAKMLDDGLSTITNIAVGTLNDSSYIAYTVDTDCDMTTQDDKQIKVFDYANNSSLNVLDENKFYLDISFETIEGESKLVWCVDNNLYYADIENGLFVIESIFENGIENLDNYRFVTDEDGNAVILFLKNGDYNRTLWGIYGNANSNTWGQPIQIIDIDNYINAYDAYFTENGLSVSYLEATVTATEEDYETECKLIFENIVDKNDVEITDIELDCSTVIPNQTTSATVSVKNNGYSPVYNYVITLTDTNGNVIAENSYTDTIQAGEIITLSFEFECPNSVDPSDYTIKIATENNADDNTSNDELSVVLWMSDLSVSAQQLVIGEDNYISATIKNNGQLQTDGTLQLLDADGKVIATKAIKTLGYGEAEEIRINLSNLEADIADTGLFGLNVVTTQNDYELGNNDDTIYVVNIEVGNGREIICEHTYGEWIVDLEPICIDTGSKHRECSICENVEYAKIEATGIHVFDNEDDEQCNYCDHIKYVVGELDGNDSLSDADALYLLLHTYFPEEYPVSQDCDFDGNGTIDDQDAVHLLFYTFFPEDYPLPTPPYSYIDTVATVKNEDE